MKPGTRYTETKYEHRFRTRVTLARRHRHLTQTQLAEQSGLWQGCISRIETGKRHITLGEAAAICDALNIPIGDMLAEQPLTVAVPLD